VKQTMIAGWFVLGILLGCVLGLAGSAVLWRRVIASYRIEAGRSILLAYDTREKLLDCEAAHRRPRLRVAR